MSAYSNARRKSAVMREDAVRSAKSFWLRSFVLYVVFSAFTNALNVTFICVICVLRV
jgi:hypothetical protein